MLSAVPLLERIRELHDGPCCSSRGPMSRGSTRVPRAASAIWISCSTMRRMVHETLVANGFVEVEDPDFEFTPEHHHLQPLRWPALPLLVGVHKASNWPVSVSRPPTVAEIREASVPSALGLDEVRDALAAPSDPDPGRACMEPRPAAHAADPIDVAAVAAPLDERELELTAKRWGIGRIWRTTSDAIDGLFYGGRETAPLRTWARHLEGVRKQSILESHVARLLHPYWEARRTGRRSPGSCARR